MKSIIQIENLSKSFKTKQTIKPVIYNFNMEVYKNEFICIVGKSGCGKSTLLKILGGFDGEYTGSVKEYDKNIMHPSIDRMMVFQDSNQLLPWKTVLENVAFPLKMQPPRKPKALLESTAMHYIDLVGMKDYMHYYPHQLSGGMKQRTALARALILKPSVLLMDEPFSSLDAMTRASLQELLYELWKTLDTTIIFVTHDIEESIKLSTRIVVMGHAPDSIKSIVPNTLTFPRLDMNEEYITLYNQIKGLLEQ